MPEHILARFGSNGSRGASIMLDAMRAFDWSATPAGAIPSWDDPLKHAARLMLLAATPMALLLGRDALLTYNDAMRDLFGDYYDGSLARPISDVLPEAADFCREAIDQCFLGESCRFADQPLKLCQKGEWTTAWFDLSFTPVADIDGRVSGVLLIASETTARVTALRELQHTQKRLDVALDASGMVGTWDIDVATNRLTCDERFARLFGMTTEDGRAGVDNDRLVDLVHPDDRRAVRTALETSTQTGADYKCRYRVLTRDNGQRWYLDVGRALRDSEGRIDKLTGIVIDLTDQVSVEDALYESEARFRALVESIPQIVWSTDAQGRHDYFNSRWTEFTGLNPAAVADDEWQRLVHPEDWPNVAEVWGECLATGNAYDIEYRFRHWSGDFRWLRVMALPVRDRDGDIIRWYGTSTDIEDQKRLAEERELVANELEHRIRNIFALVNGLVALSMRENPDVAPIAEDFQTRLSALHRAHGFIRSVANGADRPPTVQALVRRLLEPYDDGNGRIRLAGDDAELAEAMVTPLALIFHELASNSAKYGALAASAGLLTLDFQCDGEQLRAIWKETGGSAAAIVPQMGYGSRLLSLTIERQLKGSYSKTFTDNGLTFELTISAPC
ncbi:PAS domain-containing protein [Novosphingobium sp. CCH12-A3]|uniref:PAS domain-containing protein n=1 Tax=Novosphingobium sp. CCH12-A3 TaxID=1768752 RepID=UPI000780ECD2|nr:PAS domain-containing protein [Novosphingobium sp. CCH12-A3]